MTADIEEIAQFIVSRSPQTPHEYVLNQIDARWTGLSRGDRERAFARAGEIRRANAERAAIAMQTAHAVGS